MSEHSVESDAHEWIGAASDPPWCRKCGVAWQTVENDAPEEDRILNPDSVGNPDETPLVQVSPALARHFERTRCPECGYINHCHTDECSRVTSPAKSERGNANLLALAICVLTIAPLGCARWLGLTAAGWLTFSFAIVGLVVLCCTAPSTTRDRLDAEAPKAGQR
jgi:hypothetical protein